MKRDSLRPAQLVEFAPGILKERVAVRTMGCFNCVHAAENKEVAARFTAMSGLIPGESLKAKVLEKFHRDRKGFNKALGQLMAAEGLSELEAANKMAGMATNAATKKYSGLIMLGAWIAEGKATYCKINATTTPNAFVPISYLCGDNKGVPCKWLGVPGAREARAPGQAADDLLDQAFDDAETRGKKHD